MTDKDRVDTKSLEDLFAHARADPPAPSQALLDRVAAAAERHQPNTAPTGAWRGWLAALGGVPGLGGLITATCVGLWIGIAPPATLPDMGALVLGLETTTDDSFGSFGWDSEEG